MPEIEDIYELSPLQRGMLFETLFAPGSGVYHEQITFPIAPAVNVALLRDAWGAVAGHHPVLRSSFHFEDIAKPLQVVHRRAEIPFAVEDVRALGARERVGLLETFLAEDTRRGFALDRTPLMRLACFRLTDDDLRLVWSFHHALLDGWSVQLVLRDVVTAYESLQHGRVPELPACRPYSDYIGWLQRQDLAAAEGYWRDQLGGFAEATPLHVDGLAVKDDETLFDEVQLVLGSEETRAIEELVRRRQVTLNTAVQAAWAILLSRYSGEDDVVFGVVVSGRPPELADVEAMVGLFINTLPMRVRLKRGMPTGEWLAELQRDAVEMRRYEFSPLPSIAEWCGFRRGRRLFDTVLVFENYPTVGGQMSHGDSDAVRHVERTNLPLTLLIVPGKELMLKLLYDATLFDRATALRVLRHVEMIIRGLAADPERPPERLPLLTPTERRQLVETWNSTDAAYSLDVGIAELFERRATERPDAAAFLCGAVTLTYAELESRANRISRLLDADGARGGVVGLCLERSLDAAVALLGIVKAGCAFLPLDPTYPRDRLAYMVRDAGARLVVTRGAHAQLTSTFGVPTIEVDTDAGSLAAQSEEPLRLESHPDDLCYVIYTSGSTGKPKGVPVPQVQVLNRLAWMWERHPFGVHEVACHRTALGFVDSIWELLGALLAGTPTAILLDEDARDLDRLVSALAEHRVSRIWLIPSLLRALLDRFPDLQQRIPALRFWVVSGEALTLDLRDDFARILPDATLYNLYGTSEVWDATWLDPRRDPVDPGHVAIGRPIANVQTYVLDDVGAPVPVGVPGELYVGGVGLARGYVGLDHATAERFVPDPFRPGAARRLYRTGDMVRWLPNGTLEFLGRRDQQVKLRGHRIELAEIETVLRSHPAISDAAAVLDEGSSRRLIATVVADGDRLDAGAVHAFLAERLPSFMVPSAVSIVTALPLTPSGKIDRLRLVETATGAVEPTSQPVAPRSELEQQLVAMVEDLTGIERVGVLDDFFSKLGGDSLLATRLVSRIRDAFGVELALRRFFEAPSVAETATEVERLREEAEPLAAPLVRVNRERFRVRDPAGQDG